MPRSVSGKIVHHHADPVRVWIVDIGQIAHAIGEVARGSMVRDFHMTPGFVCVEKHEQIGRAVAPIFAIVTLRLTRRGRDRLAYLTDQLCRTFVEANHRTPGIGLFGIKIEHFLHPGDISAVHLRNAPHLAEPGLQVVLGQPPAYRLTRQSFMLRQLDHLAGQQIQCPALAACRRAGAGGRHQQRRLLAGQLASGSRPRFFAQCEFQVAFHEAPFGPVNRRSAHRDTARDRFVADPRVGGQQDLRSFEFARRMFAAAQHRREFRAFRLVQFHPVPYVHG